ncbi:MAG: hypothetical protein KY455_12010 [Euryarchaeota archaeon]|nr:hypothetical protein [Euryarchaeota archaeon]
MRGTRWAFTAVTILALANLPTGSAFHEPIPDHPNKFVWSTPANHTGDILVEIGVDYGADNACMVYMGAAGRSDGTGLRRIKMSDDGGWSAGSGGSTLTYVAQAHAGPVDTRDITDFSGGFWAGRSWTWGDHFRGNETWTFAAFDTMDVTFGDETRQGFEFEIGCRDPFTVTSKAGSTSVIGFDEKTMEGTGASFSTLFGPEGAVNVQDGVAGTFDHDETVLAIRGFSGAGTSAGKVTLDHPQGSDQYLINSASPNVDHRGPAGAYDLRVDRVGIALADVFWGILGGLDHVDDMDEILE